MSETGILIRLNGEETRLARAETIRAMLTELGLNPAKVAVERNLEVVPRSRYDEEAVADGDRIEIVHFIGGG